MVGYPNAPGRGSEGILEVFIKAFLIVWRWGRHVPKDYVAVPFFILRLPRMVDGLKEFCLDCCVPAIQKLSLLTTETALALRFRSNRISYDPVVGTAAFLCHDNSLLLRMKASGYLYNRVVLFFRNSCIPTLQGVCTENSPNRSRK